MASSFSAIRLPTDPIVEQGYFDDLLNHHNDQLTCNVHQNLSEKALTSRVYDALLGRQPEPATLREYHFFVTLLYLFLTVNVCRVFRLVNHNLVPTILRPLVGDVICTFQTIACGFEHGFVKKVYGTGFYCIQTLCLGFWSARTFGANCSANPVTNFKHFFLRKYGFSRTIIHMIAQMFSGLLAYRYASSFWKLELSPEHTSKLMADEDCVTDLNVPVVMGFFVEMSAAVIDTVVSRTTTKRFMFERYEQFAKGVFSIWMTIMGVHLTGLYINPSSATARNFGCAGVSKTDFIFVYWLGPIFGAAIGLIIHQNFRTALRAVTSQFGQVINQSGLKKLNHLGNDLKSALILSVKDENNNLDLMKLCELEDKIK